MQLETGSKILVSGGAGYIGSHVCKAISEKGYCPVTYDNLSRGHAHSVKWGPLEVGDVADTEKIREVCNRHHPIAAVHMAAFAYVGESTHSPSLYYSNNIVGSVRFVEAIRASGIKFLVFSSSCATYGVPAKVPISETDSQYPVNPYGTTKLFVERLLQDYDLAYGFKSAALRYFNAAGADPGGEIGEEHDPEPHLIPIVLEVAAGRRRSVEIFGDDYSTPDGTCVRDYVHVVDLADAHVRALDYLAIHNESLTLNLGTGKGHSVREIILETERITGKNIPYKVSPRRAGDPPVLFAEAGRAGTLLGWKPERSDLSTILSDAWRWMSRKLGTAN